MGEGAPDAGPGHPGLEQVAGGAQNHEVAEVEAPVAAVVLVRGQEGLAGEGTDALGLQAEHPGHVGRGISGPWFLALGTGYFDARFLAEAFAFDPPAAAFLDDAAEPLLLAALRLPEPLTSSDAASEFLRASMRSMI